jgi:hypothetical protein
MVTNIENLVAKYGGLSEVNSLWERIAGRPFINDAQSKLFKEYVFEKLVLCGVRIVLLGTAHASSRSARLAETWVKHLQPSTLVLERCPERLAELAWPKSLLMDHTAHLRAINVLGRGEVSVDQLRSLGAPSKLASRVNDDEAEEMASNLWAEFELLNTERNHQVDEAALHAWARQTSPECSRLLALADLRMSKNGLNPVPGGGPDQAALAACRSSRDAHICDCIAACASLSSGPILVILGLNHLENVSSRLQQCFGAQCASGFRCAESNFGSASGQAGVVEHLSGALLGTEAIMEILQLHNKRSEALQKQKRSAEEILDGFIEDVENGEALFESFVVRDAAIEVSPPAMLSKL